MRRGAGDVLVGLGPREAEVEEPGPAVAVSGAAVAVDEDVGGERGGPGAGEAAAPEGRPGRKPREDVLDDVVGEDRARMFHGRRCAVYGERERRDVRATYDRAAGFINAGAN